MNKRLLLLNGLAILAVVANHASHMGFVAMFWWTDRYRAVSVPNFDAYGSFSYYWLVAQQKLALFSVPSFLFVTGIFIAYSARGVQSQLNWVMVKRRILNILLPYLIWTFVFFLSEWILDTRYSLTEYVTKFFGFNQPPFFYVPVLIICYILAPILAPLAKSRWRLLLSVALVLHLATITRSYLTAILEVSSGSRQGLVSLESWLPKGQVFEYIFYFVFGLVAGFRLTELSKFVTKFRWGLLIGVLLLAVIAVVEAEWFTRMTDNPIWRSVTLTLPTFLYAICFILGFLGFSQAKLPLENVLYQIGSSSLGIYLIHRSILLFIPKIIYHVAPGMMAYQLIFQAVLVSTATAGAVFLMSFTRRTPARRFYRYFYG